MAIHETAFREAQRKEHNNILKFYRDITGTNEVGNGQSFRRSTMIENFIVEALTQRQSSSPKQTTGAQFGGGL